MRYLKFLLFYGLMFLCNQALVAQDYYVYVAAESDDEVSLIHFDGETGKGNIAETIEVGTWPQENEGPHGLTVSPDGKHWFVSIAHGQPYGKLWKYETGTNEFVEEVELGMFPATMDISASTGLLYVVNFNLHGDMEPSTVSVIDPESMMRLADIETGIMPHGSRVNDEGTRQYHVSMMTDELMEINTKTLEVQRRLKLSENGSQSMHASSNMDHSGMKRSEVHHPKPVEKPTWADPHPTKPLVYVAGNGSDEIIVIDTKKWEITNRWDTGKAPYNLEVSHDGKLLVVTYKGEGATGVWDLESGKELAKIKNSRKVSHGVAISADNKYAFISVEGIGGEPGSVDIINLEKLERVDVVETGKQAGGIIFWKQENLD
ncbi:YncE family protein [Gracilimonas mengyeensis]|uniref:DNA-binding beta-propeller fold protein YncE n=1 Tax=Gracilimonas mengyeensis TaxID=1302730 RepID=A0A521F5K1_9BACT|nr:YncE family protein [Gracilimonas mengyeensis]SMO91429.1 DNA-binding beta-propeller fold protein YncE [Gracilimonas mengyeensis]